MDESLVNNSSGILLDPGASGTPVLEVGLPTDAQPRFQVSAVGELFRSDGGGQLKPYTPTLVGARVAQTSAQSLTTAVSAMAVFDTVRFDTRSFWSAGAPTRLTIPFAGYYTIGGSASPASVKWEVILNGTTGIAVTPALWFFAAGDYVELSLLQSTGGTINTVPSTASNKDNVEFWVQMVGA